MKYQGTVDIDMTAKITHITINGDTFVLSRADVGILFLYNKRSACTRDELISYLAKIHEEATPEALNRSLGLLKGHDLLLEVDLWLYRTDKGQGTCMAIEQELALSK